MMSKKTIRMISGAIAAILVIVMVVSVVVSGLVPLAGAADADELKDKLSTLEEQKSAIKAELASLGDQVSDIEAARKALNSEIELTKQEIATVEDYISRLQTQIDVKTSELTVAEEQLQVKKDQLDECVRETYEQGDTSYLEVVLNSKSLTDMLSRIEVVTQLIDHNKKVVEEFRAAKEDIEKKRDDLQTTQDEQKNYQENLSYKADELAANEKQQAALQESLEAYKSEQEAEYDRIASEMASVSSEIAAMSRQSAAAGGIPYSGTFVWPTPSCTSNSSAYGWRIHPIFGTRKFHAGEDIPAGYGAEILAAASGTVTTAGWVSGYGNYTVIDHGGGVMTAYGHQSSQVVSVGQYVEQGQVIGYVGSTGNSTGPHLHFEVYVNGQTTDPKSYFTF